VFKALQPWPSRNFQAESSNASQWGSSSESLPALWAPAATGQGAALRDFIMQRALQKRTPKQLVDTTRF